MFPSAFCARDPDLPPFPFTTSARPRTSSARAAGAGYCYRSSRAASAGSASPPLVVSGSRQRITQPSRVLDRLALAPGPSRRLARAQVTPRRRAYRFGEGRRPLGTRNGSRAPSVLASRSYGPLACACALAAVLHRRAAVSHAPPRDPRRLLFPLPACGRPAHILFVDTSPRLLLHDARRVSLVMRGTAFVWSYRLRGGVVVLVARTPRIRLHPAGESPPAVEQHRQCRDAPTRCMLGVTGRRRRALVL